MVVTAATGTGLAAEAVVTIHSQRLSNRQGFDVTHQSVQRPSSEPVTTGTGLADLQPSPRRGPPTDRASTSAANLCSALRPLALNLQPGGSITFLGYLRRHK